MKAHIIGVSRMHGTSKKTGRPYDMARCYVLQPCDVVANDAYTKVGHGYQVAEMEMRPDALTKFSDLKFPATVELITDNEMQFGRIITVITGYKVAAA
mgnify:CR=1 FL=1